MQIETFGGKHEFTRFECFIAVLDFVSTLIDDSNVWKQLFDRYKETGWEMVFIQNGEAKMLTVALKAAITGELVCAYNSNCVVRIYGDDIVLIGISRSIEPKIVFQRALNTTEWYEDILECESTLMNQGVTCLEWALMERLVADNPKPLDTFESIPYYP